MQIRSIRRRIRLLRYYALSMTLFTGVAASPGHVVAQYPRTH
ncbi:MAG TPA: hypothetical protein VMV82_11285 [Candidatus Dormibacteraeota bacterium]|nr:hypothetical protein [Candidatus Dormibacteraeota bacterium]